MSSIFDQRNIEEINREFDLLQHRYSKLLIKFAQLSTALKEAKAKEYLLHGAARRIRVLQRCIENIFHIFPLERESLLNRDELNDVMINLHAFFVNIFGILDNFAWVWVYEKKLSEEIRKEKVGLFKPKVKSRFPKEFREYLDSDQIQRWHSEYLKNYRDALSHRIPLYVPPKTLNSAQKMEVEDIEQKIAVSCKSGDWKKASTLTDGEEQIGGICPFFIHSFTETEQKYVAFHVQLIADFKTIEEITEKYLNSCFTAWRPGLTL